MLARGELAPEFDIPDSDGHTVRLADYRGRQRVVLYFFPACFTPGCDIEAGRFRDELAKFEGKHAQVIGVSHDDALTARKYREHFRLPFPLLPDPSGRVIGLYGVGGSSGRARRVTFLIGLDGRVEEVVDDRMPEPHIEGTLRALEGP